MAKRDRRADIMRAAERLFTSRRFHEITLDHVVEEAGVGKGTVYRYFRDKDDLFFQTATSGFDELCELLAERQSVRLSFRERLLDTCRRISEFFARRRQLLQMMQSEEDRMRWVAGDLRQRWVQRRRKLVTAVAEIVRDGVAAGQVRKDLPPEVQATFLLGLLRTRARDLADAPESWRRLELVVDFFCRAVAPGVAPAADRVRGSVSRARMA